MTEPARAPLSVASFAVWAPLLSALRGFGAATAFRVAGRVGPADWRCSLGSVAEGAPGDPVAAGLARIRAALRADGVEAVTFSAVVTPGGAATLRVHAPSPAVDGGGPRGGPGTLVLVPGAVPEPWRRLPRPVPDARPAPSADPALLARLVRERLPAVEGAGETELSAAEERLGRGLPAELRALYGTVGGAWPDEATARRVWDALGFELLPLAEVYAADAASRPCRWGYGATWAPRSRAVVQPLAGSPGWLVLGENGGGDALAVDLTPGPEGHLGHVLLLGHEEYAGAEPLAESLTALIRSWPEEDAERYEAAPVVAHVNAHGLPDVAAAAHPALEVLSLGVRAAPPVSLAPVFGLPRLRTLIAYAGTLADPREVARLTALEYLELSPGDWRAVLDAGAVPPGLLAAGLVADEEHAPRELVALANEILALTGRPPLVRATCEGDLGPAVREGDSRAVPQGDSRAVREGDSRAAVPEGDAQAVREGEAGPVPRAGDLGGR